MIPEVNWSSCNPNEDEVRQYWGSLSKNEVPRLNNNQRNPHIILDCSQRCTDEPYSPLLLISVLDTYRRYLTMRDIRFSVRGLLIPDFENDRKSNLLNLNEKLGCINHDDYLQDSNNFPEEISSIRNLNQFGSILGEDGQKMSRKRRNYPPPEDLIKNLESEALRFYLLSSPAAQGKDVSLSVDQIELISRKILQPLRNVCRFFNTYSEMCKWKPRKNDEQSDKTKENIMDQWIQRLLSDFHVNLTSALSDINMPEAAKHIQGFIEDLSGWYLRVCRNRFTPAHDPQDQQNAFEVLYGVLLEFSRLIAPILPYLSEMIYQALSAGISVHLSHWPESKPSSETLILDRMQKTREIIKMGLSLRMKHGIKLRQPLGRMYVRFTDDVSRDSNSSQFFQLLAQQLNVKSLTQNENIINKKTVVSKKSGGAEIFLDLSLNKSLRLEGAMRELTRSLQKMRKENGYHPSDQITIRISGADSLMVVHEGDILSAVRANNVSPELKDPDSNKTLVIQDMTIRVQMKRVS